MSYPPPSLVGEAGAMELVLEQPESQPVAMGLSLAFLTSAEKMDIMLASPREEVVTAIGDDIIARRSEEDLVNAQLLKEVSLTVAGRSAGAPKKMKKPARRSASASPDPPPAAAQLPRAMGSEVFAAPQLPRGTGSEESLPRVAAAPERFLSSAELLQAFGYTETAPEPEVLTLRAEKLPAIACARSLASLAPPALNGSSPRMRLSCDGIVNALISPPFLHTDAPSVCSPRNVGAAVIKRTNRLPPRRWASEGFLGR